MGLHSRGLPQLPGFVACPSLSLAFPRVQSNLETSVGQGQDPRETLTAGLDRRMSGKIRKEG